MITLYQQSAKCRRRKQLKMERQYYPLSASQQIVNLQTTVTLFKRVGNIVFSLTFDKPLDRSAMEKSINLLFERVDSLRTRFVKVDGKQMQYFATGTEPLKFKKTIIHKDRDEVLKFIGKFRLGMLKPSKGETLTAAFTKNPEGKDEIYIKVSHFVADTYAIGIIIEDLLGVYDALVSGTPLPEAPAPFEPVLKKDIEFLQNDALLSKDREFYEDFFTVRHREHPLYCGLHGNNSSLWLKYKRKGCFSIPYQFIKCDTEGYRYVIPKSIVEKALKWCESEKVTPANFFFYSYCLACSLRNDRAPIQHPLMLLNSRATLAEKKCAGTKVQSVGLYTTLDYEKSFNENVKAAIEEQSEQYRHTRMSYVDVQQLQHKVWGHSQLHQLDNFCYSFIPFRTPKGVTMQVHSNGKGALTAYVALMFNPDTLEIQAVYDVQSIMTSAVELAEFQNILISTIEKVLDNPDKKLNEIL